MTSHSERARQWVHVGSGAFALTLRALTWWQAAALAASALAFNALVLPRIGGRRLYRPIDHARGFPVGILLYPLAVLFLILIFPLRLDIVAAAWAILALGDGAATLVGRATTRNAKLAKTPKKNGSAAFADLAFLAGPLPWNRDKTVAGTTAFIACGAIGGVALAWWTRPSIMPQPSLAFVVIAPVVAAIAAAFVETIPVRLDDNVSVPATAGFALWMATEISPAAIEASRAAMLSTLPVAIAINALVAWLGHRMRTVSMAGAIGGAIVGTIIYAGAGGGAWVLLLLTFVAASAASRLGLQRKVLLGIEEDRGGRRGAGNAIANCGVAALAAIAAATTTDHADALLALAAALTAGGSDTVASEIGKAFGRSTFLVTTLGRVKPGTPGAMSLEGTAAGLVAALALGAAGVPLGVIPATALFAVVIGATAGALIESALAATLEGPGILNNDMLNFINTAAAAVVAMAIA